MRGFTSQLFFRLRNPNLPIPMASKRSKRMKTLTSPSRSKRRKKSNLSAPTPCCSSSTPHQLTPNYHPKRARATALPSTSSESSHSPPSAHSPVVETVSYSTSHGQRGYDIPNLLKAVASFRLRNGTAPTMSKFMSYFLNEVKDFVPKGTSEKRLVNKLYHLRQKFWKEHSTQSDCVEFDRSFYELGVKAWGSRLRANGYASRSVNLLENDEADSPYKYLKHALKEFWIAQNLDLNVLQLALQKVDSVQAKHLDEQFMEIAKDELKLKIEKNRLTNDIISVLCTDV